MAEKYLDITLYNDIAKIPQFNPDKDVDEIDSEVDRFRRLLSDAEGIIICTPEYAHGVPGTLKNAIDWTISTSQFPGKPTMLITASTDGNFGHKALLQTLKAIEAKNIDNLNLVISYAKTKITNENRIIDNTTYIEVEDLLSKFIQTLHC